MTKNDGPIEFTWGDGWTMRLMLRGQGAGDRTFEPLGCAGPEHIIAALLANPEVRMQVLEQMPEYARVRAWDRQAIVTALQANETLATHVLDCLDPVYRKHSQLRYNVEKRAEAAEEELVALRRELQSIIDAWDRLSGDMSTSPSDHVLAKCEAYANVVNVLRAVVKQPPPEAREEDVIVDSKPDGAPPLKAEGSRDGVAPTAQQQGHQSGSVTDPHPDWCCCSDRMSGGLPCRPGECPNNPARNARLHVSGATAPVSGGSERYPTCDTSGRVSHEEALEMISGMANASGWYAVERKLRRYVAQQEQRDREHLTKLSGLSHQLGQAQGKAEEFERQVNSLRSELRAKDVVLNETKTELDLSTKRYAATDHARRRKIHDQRTQLNRLERAYTECQAELQAKDAELAETMAELECWPNDVAHLREYFMAMVNSVEDPDKDVAAAFRNAYQHAADMCQSTLDDLAKPATTPPSAAEPALEHTEGRLVALERDSVTRAELVTALRLTGFSTLADRLERGGAK